MVSPARRREAVLHLVERFGSSQRPACLALGSCPPTQPFHLAVTKRLRDLGAVKDFIAEVLTNGAALFAAWAWPTV